MRIKSSALALLAFLLSAAAAFATINIDLQMLTGNPSAALDTNPTANRTNFLIKRAQYAFGYNDATREPNWVAWNLTSSDVGGSGRSPNFFQDTTLPSGFYQVLPTDYSGSGYDRGHLCPSADRTIDRANNDVVFYMSNMMPQAPDNNQGVWANFETYCRTLAGAGNEVLIIAGPGGFAGNTIASGVAIPGFTWKIAVVVPVGAGTAISRIDANTRVIAVKIPNLAGVRNTPWENFITSAAQLQTDTGYTFFTEAALSGVAPALRAKVDGQVATGSPSVTTQPSAQTAPVGGNASFTVVASGNATLTYQWLKDDDAITGNASATTSTLNLTNIQAADAAVYTVVVTNSVGSITSSGAALVITGLPPVVVTPPASITRAAGTNAVFTVTASGSPTLNYQWRKGGSNLTNTGNVSGATSATLTVSNVQSADAANYDVVVTNSVNSAISASATLTVTPAAPFITTNPTTQVVSVGGTLNLAVAATGTAPLSYQWRKGGSPLTNTGNISGATTANLTLTGVQTTDTGSYDVVVSNGVGTDATSSAAVVTVSSVISGNIVVERIGDGTTTLGSTAAVVAVQTVSRAGSVLSTVTFPTAGTQPTSAPFNLTEAGTSTADGYLNRSSDGSIITVPGYNAILGASGVASSSGATTGRTIGVISATGTVSTPLAVNIFSGNAYRSVVSDGANYWASGANGVAYITAAGAVTSLFGSNARNIEIYNGTLYASSSSTAFNGTGTPGIWRLGAIGTLPTTALGTTPSANVVQVFSTATGSSPYGFAISPDGNWAYVADDRATTSGGGIQKWNFNGTAWVLSYTLGTGTGSTVGARGLAVDFANFNSTTGVGAALVATTAETTLNRLIYFASDTDSSVVPAVLATNTANYIFRGVDFAPVAPPSAPTVASNTPSSPALSTSPITLTFNQPVNVSGSWFSIVSGSTGPIAATVTGGPTTFTLTPPTSFTDGDTVTVTVFASQITDQATGALHPAADYTFSFQTAAPVAPSIATAPTPQTAAAGATATFTVAAAGTPPFSYQWRKNSIAITGNGSATSPTLVLTNVQAADATTYDVVITNSVTSTTSTPVALTVTPTAPTITTQPLAQAVLAGGNASFTVAATGTTPFSYQWRKGGVPLVNDSVVSGATTAALTLTGVTATDAGNYDVVVTNGVNPAATSNAVTFTVNPTPTSIITWDFATATPTSGLPSDITGATVIQGNNNGTTALLTSTSASSTYTGSTGGNNAGAAARIGALNPAASGSAYFEFTLSPAATKQLTVSTLSFGTRSTGTGPQAYALYSSADNFAAPLVTGSISADSTWRQISPTFPAVNSGTASSLTFRLFGYNGAGSPGTGTANWRIDDLKVGALTTVMTPNITTQPSVQVATAFTTATFTVAATSSQPVTYQWRKNGTAITGNASATTANLTLTALTVNDAANYDCVVTNLFGSVTTNTAALNVNPANSAISLTNLAATYDGTPKAVTVTTVPAGQPVTLAYAGSATPPTDAGTYVVTATVSIANYSGNASAILTIAKAAQTVSFGALPSSVAPGVAFTLNATASTGLPVTLSVVSGNATVSGNSVTLSDTAAVTLRATQPGNNNYASASADTTVTAGKLAQTIAVTSIPAQLSTAAPITLSATATSGLPVTFALVSGPASLSGNVLTLTGAAGTVVVRASQAGNAAYNAAPNADLSFAVTVGSVAPRITAQPVSQVAQIGGTAAFSVTATGSPAPTYQWRKDGVTLAGATAASLSLASLTAADAAGYDVVVTNASGSVTSSLARLTVNTAPTAPVITRQPGNVVAVVGRSASFTVVATGSPAPTYQWSKGTAAIPGATSATLILASVTAADAGTYTVTVTNSAGSATATASLRVIARSYAGTYFGTLGNGGRFALRINDDNTGVFLGFVPPGSSTVFVSRAIVVDDNGHFSFVANSNVATASAPAEDTAGSPRVAAAPGDFTFEGNISDSGTLTSTSNSVPLSATRSSDTGATAATAGFYQAGAAGSSAQTLVIVSPAGQAFVVTQNGVNSDAGSGTADATGKIAVTTTAGTVAASVSADTAALTATVTTSGSTTTFTGYAANAAALADQRIVNISTRTTAGTGDQVAIVGFVITGLESKPVLVRAVGPALRGLGVTTALAAPRLDLRNATGALLSTNTGWSSGGNAAEIANAAARSGAFPLATGSADSVILTTLAPGAYSAVISASDNVAGVGLVEVYDLSGGSMAQKLANLSTRAAVGSGEATLISGLVVGGSAPKRVLIRAAGPSLAPFGVTNALTRPSVTLYSATGAVLAQNSGWSTSADSAAIAEGAARVGAFAFAASSADAALIVNLAPGAYTAQVTGVAGAAGTTLLEVYELP